MADTATVDATDTTDATTTDAQTTGDATGTNGGNSTERTFTQADVDRIVNERLKRAAEKADEERQKAEADAEAKRLEDQKEFETLATQRAERIRELETKLEQATAVEQELERSNKALETYVAALRDGLPQSVLVLLDGRPLPDQLEWLTQNRDEVLGQKSAPEKPKGVPASPKASGNGIPDDEKRRRAANTWRG